MTARAQDFEGAPDLEGTLAHGLQAQVSEEGHSGVEAGPIVCDLEGHRVPPRL